MNIPSSSSNSSKDGHQSPEATLSPTSVVTTPSTPSESPIRREANIGSNEDGIPTSATTALPGFVTMVQSASFASLLPSGAATVSTAAREGKSSCMMPKPFFVMDWLEEINPRDLELARQMLQTPTKKREASMIPSPVITQKPISRCSSPDSQEQPQQQRDSDPSTRSSISLPTLSPTREEAEDGSFCRQLFRADANRESEANAESFLPSMITSPATASHKTTTNSNEDQSSTTPSKMSPFRKRSISIGNGWNAKGLHKAKKGSWESALSCWENALVIRTQVLGETHPDVANTCNNIGIAMGKLGRFDAAIEILEQALELRAKHYGTREHAVVAATIHNIGNVLHAARDYAGAIQCFWDAKSLQEKLLGPNHIQVARACVAIAHVYNEAFQYQDAREAYLDALKIFNHAGLTVDHPEVAGVREDLLEMEQMCLGQVQQQQHTLYSQHHCNQLYHWHQGYPDMTTNGDVNSYVRQRLFD